MKAVLYLIAALFVVGSALIGAVAEGIVPYYWGVLEDPKVGVMRAGVLVALLAAALFAAAARRAR